MLCQHNDICFLFDVQFRQNASRNDRPFDQIKPMFVRADDSHFQATVLQTAFLLNDLHRNDTPYRRYRAFQTLHVRIQQAIDTDTRPHVGLAAFLRRLLCRHDDIAATELADLLQSNFARAFTDGQHRDNTADTEHEAQHRQKRPQLVKHQVLDA